MDDTKYCKYCKTKMHSDAIICPACNNNQLQKWKNRTTTLIIIGIITVAATLVCTLITTYTAKRLSERSDYTSKILSEQSDNITFMQIQNECRKRFSDWREEVREKGISLRDTVGIYNHDKETRDLLLRYWDIICFDEYIIFKKFGGGVGEKFWPFVEPQIKHAIIERKTLEYYLNEYLADDFKLNTLKEPYKNYLDSLRWSLIKEEKERSANVQNAQTELDLFFMYLTYAIVFKDWQENAERDNRGYNIGALLVDADKNPVAWSLNSTQKKHNKTLHAETSLIYNYLDTAAVNSLAEYSIYTTLDPCAMCAGMIVMADVKDVVYGQSDPEYGNVFEKLQHKPLPYPKTPAIRKSKDQISCELDRLYQLSLEKNPEHHITRFLTQEEAKRLFEQSTALVNGFSCSYKDNVDIVNKAKSLFNKQMK